MARSTLVENCIGAVLIRISTWMNRKKNDGKAPPKDIVLATQLKQRPPRRYVVGAAQAEQLLIQMGAQRALEICRDS